MAAGRLLAFVACLLAARLPAQDGSLHWALTLQGWSVSSPAVSPDGGTVYVGVETRTAGRLIAVGSDGAVRWSSLRPDGISASPAVGPDGTVFVGCYDGKLYALNPANGSLRWQYDAGSFIVSSPAVDGDGGLYFGTGDGRLHAVDARGLRRWTYQTGDWIIWPEARGIEIARRSSASEAMSLPRTGSSKNATSQSATSVARRFASATV
ncbi:MAG: hypothetical protein RLZZ188_3004 [Verrucomicrobiota bacterium]